MYNLNAAFPVPSLRCLDKMRRDTVGDGHFGKLLTKAISWHWGWEKKKKNNKN